MTNNENKTVSNILMMEFSVLHQFFTQAQISDQVPAQEDERTQPSKGEGQFNEAHI